MQEGEKQRQDDIIELRKEIEKLRQNQGNVSTSNNDAAMVTS